MKSSLPIVKPIALKRPRGAHRFDAFSPKLIISFMQNSKMAEQGRLLGLSTPLQTAFYSAGHE
ncbi:hypothetical protein [Paraburkholderia sediminicola]|uniref:hypothetical protein n=1 Tax=Paraburkholderia sediminicola TaxID=458836 RepID=UPI0038BB2211